ncbi:unnamed protein product [Cladocopium goreaui]|uniref:Uncharacterized protein n=1 Tax=Cladocopium goreaui TaxID=2562237 RepID=A0A9P1BLJ0_9DINO|nr:unnamed protein product [Cladocopium goreaui]
MNQKVFVLRLASLGIYHHPMLCMLRRRRTIGTLMSSCTKHSCFWRIRQPGRRSFSELKHCRPKRSLLVAGIST